MNRVGDPGENPLSRNFNWSLPVLELPGRAGLDLSLALSYNSLVWTKAGNYIAYDLDKGYPGPGFRLGFPVIQKKYHNRITDKDSFMIIMPSGSRVELRRVGNTNGYESADSSYLQLIDNGGLLVRTTDGTQLSYSLFGNEYQCTEVKDRNGNFISISYNNWGISTVIDTLGRSITFNYDGDGYLTSITQPWTVQTQQGPQEQTHAWARFTYGSPDLTINTNFPNLTVIGPRNNSTIKVLTEVKLADDSSYKFDYSPYGQVYQVSHYAADSQNGSHRLGYQGYNLENPDAQDDCPRFTERFDQAENWNNDQPVTTLYEAPAPASWMMPGGSSFSGLVSQVTTPDGTVNKMYTPAEGWGKGLVMRTETLTGGQVKRWTSTSWTQDDPSLTYKANPRSIETNVGDLEGNRRRTTTEYQGYSLQSGTTCYLPKDVKEYNADATTVLRYSRSEYNMAAAYTDRWIIGLVSKQYLYDGNNQLFSKVEYLYDEDGRLQDQASIIQHDASYDTGLREGRGLLTSVRRWDVNSPDDVTKAVTSRMGYNIAGSVVLKRDPLWQPGQSSHQVTVSYTDSFSDNANRNTFAYPTTVTDEGGSVSTLQYNYDFGTVTRTQTPPPHGFTEGPVQATEYDLVGRPVKVKTLLNDNVYRYIRLEYPTSQTVINTYSTIQDGAGEAFSTTVLDGAGRTIATASDLSHTAGGRAGQLFIYDTMGRRWKVSNPAETSASGWPWITTGEDEGTGWQFVTQNYDWKGRPLVTTNVDGTSKEVTYGGCGCAGGEVSTFRDEAGRKQRVTADVLGRNWKTEVLNWDGSVYSTTTNTYNARDQITGVLEQGADGGTSQTTTLTYDGHGRLKTQRLPRQTADTEYSYYKDDNVYQAKDGRGVITTYVYNDRHQPTNISYSGAPAGVTATAPVTISYDDAGNRTSMSDGSGSVTYQYDQLSRVTSETRQFTGLSGIYTISYGYNLDGGLTSLTDPTGASISYAYDKTGRLTDITGSSFAGVTQYASNIQRRAWGGLKVISTGDGRTTEVYYNSRLQPTDFSVGTSNTGLISKHYDYNADGRLRYSQDQLDNRFDRSYTYDHAGRVVEAFSGPLARGQADVNDRPYKLNYQYDALNHLTLRAGKQWSKFGLIANTGSGTYEDGRNTGWAYDADGRLLDDGETQYAYDTAGRAITVVSNNGDMTQQQTFDGNGSRIKMQSQLVIHNEDGTNTIDTKVQYYITSSMIGGVLTELDEVGQKTRTFVYNGSRVLAWQQKNESTETIAWEHRDLSNASVRIPGATEGSEAAELDPLGSNAGTSNPFTSPPHHSQGQDLTYPAFASLFSKECNIFGVPAPCSQTLGWESIDFIGASTGNMPGMNGATLAYGFLGREHGVPPGPVPIDLAPDFAAWLANVKGIWWEPSEEENLYALDFAYTFGHPQNTVIGFETLWEDLADIIKDGTCRSFIADLIGTAQAQTGKKAHAFSVEGMLAELAKHPNNGTNGINLYETGGKELIGYGGWNKETGKGGVDLGDIINRGADIRAGHRTLARMFLHEIIHTATKFATATDATGGYSDVEVARAIFGITGDWRDNPDDPRNKSPRGYQTTVSGVIFNRALQKYCK